MKISRIVSAFALIAVLVTGCGGGSTSNMANAKEIVKVVNTEAEKNSELQTSSQFDCSFELEGKTYSVPFALTTLREDGWELRGTTWEELEKKDIGGNTISFVYLKKDGKDEEITAHIINASGDGQKITDCQVYRIEVEQRSLDPLPYSFALSNGIKLGDNLDSVRQLMGEPTGVTDDNDSYVDMYYIIESKNIRIDFFQDKEQAFIYYIVVAVDNLTKINS